MNLFLEVADLAQEALTDEVTASLTGSEAAALGGIVAVLAGMVFVMILYTIAVYVSFGYGFMKIGKKAKAANPALSWVPFVGPHIVAFQSAKMHWWPWLLIIGFFIPFVSFPASLIFAVYTVIWTWKMLEKAKLPGWWSILFLLPIVNIVMVLVAASKD